MPKRKLSKSTGQPLPPRIAEAARMRRDNPEWASAQASAAVSTRWAGKSFLERIAERAKGRSVTALTPLTATDPVERDREKKANWYARQQQKKKSQAA